MPSRKTIRKRNKHGAVLSEFGPAMLIFICFLLIPLIDISFIPVRYFMTQGIVANTAQRLSLAEKRSDANTLAQSTWWTDFLTKCGVTVHPRPVHLVVCDAAGSDKLALAPGADVPNDWLPGGSKGPCVYAMELTVDADIPPLYKTKTGLPGFNAPLHMVLSGRSNWENLSRDPVTHKYFINE